MASTEARLMELEDQASRDTLRCIFIYIYIYIYTHICIYIYIYVYVDIFIDLLFYLYIYRHAALHYMVSDIILNIEVQ